METTKLILEQVEELCDLIGAFRTEDDKWEDIQDRINTIRVGVKYLLYDKEADDREKTYLRKLLYD